jgi:hypothetical protein
MLAQDNPQGSEILRFTRQGLNSLRVEAALRMVHDADVSSLAISICRPWVNSMLDIFNTDHSNVTSSTAPLELATRAIKNIAIERLAQLAQQMSKRIKAFHRTPPFKGKCLIPGKTVATGVLIGAGGDSRC